MGFLLQPEQQANEIRRGKPASRSPFSSQPSLSMDLQSQIGNQAIQSLFRSGTVQASLAVGHVDDPAEHEANEVAARIMGAPANSQTFRQGGTYRDNAPANVSGIVEQVAHSHGHPLDPATRSFFESRLGHNFSHVRVHTGPEAAASARSINALAYTAGSDIVFAHGRYSPHTDDGKRLLAHELAHTIQQSSRASRIVRRSPDLGGLTVSVTHTGTNVPISGANVHIDQKLVSSTKSIDLVTDGSGNTPSIQLEEGSYTITVSYKCCQQTQDVRISGNVDQVSFFEFGRCGCGIASSDHDGDSTVASGDSNSPSPDAQANA